LLLEEKRKEEYEDLKIQFYKTSENFRPINIFRQALKDFREIPDVKTNLFETLISITGGYFSKKIIIGKSNSLVKNIFGYVLQYTVTNFISKKVSTDSE
jgi:deoxyhypusine synthase